MIRTFSLPGWRWDVWCLVVSMGLCTPSSGWSQPPAHTSSPHGIALAAGLGKVSDASGTAVAVATSLAWEMTPQLSLEGGTTLFDGGAGASGVGTVFGARAALASRRAAPYLSGGAGVYRAVFDDSAQLPACYRGRVASGTAGQGSRYVFNDLTYAVGAGVDVFLSRHLALRPEARVLLVRVDGRTHPIWMFGSQLAFHVEAHAVATRWP